MAKDKQQKHEVAGAKAASNKMRRKEFEKELAKLQVELARLQTWVQATGARIIVIFEGRDTAGKGGVISRITARTSPRVYRHVALPAPSDREKTQVYAQRYIAHFPAAGEIILFDRSVDLLSQQSGEDVAGTARWVRNNNFDGPRRLRPCSRTARRKKAAENRKSGNSSSPTLHPARGIPLSFCRKAIVCSRWKVIVVNPACGGRSPAAHGLHSPR
jgi:hypothetical protein